VESLSAIGRSVIRADISPRGVFCKGMCNFILVDKFT